MKFAVKVEIVNFVHL